MCIRSLIRASVVALAVLLGSAADARAVDVKLWPLFRYARDDATGQLRWSAFGPFIEYAHTPETRDLRIRPFLSIHQRRGETPDDSADIMYPLASSRWTPDEQSFRFLLFTYRTQAKRSAPEPVPDAAPDETPHEVDAPYASRLTIFPFVFYRHEPEAGTTLSVLPFWLDLDDFAGWEHVGAVMFPAWLELTEPRVERTFHPFPFVSTVGGPDGDGLRLWPFWGRTEVAGRERSQYVLWPFHIRSEVQVPGYGWERRRVNFPFWAAIDGEARTSRAWGMIAYTHTVDRRQGDEVTASPWPFVLRAKEIGAPDYYTWRLAPIYGRTDRDGMSSRFYAWPLYREKHQDLEDYHYTRRDSFFLLWRRQTIDDEAKGRHERLHTLFPVLRAVAENERRSGQAPAILDSLMPLNRGVLNSWAPLWAFARWDTRPSADAEGILDWNLGYGLVARENGHVRGPWYLALDDGG